jgi:hypothetical protein
MTMNTFKLTIAATVAVFTFIAGPAGIAPGAAKAVPTQHFTERGTGIDVDVFGNSADGCVSLSVQISASTSMTRPDGGTSSGMVASVFRDDFCAGTFEFGAAFVSFTTELQVSNNNHGASLTFTIPIDTFDEFGSTSHTLSANVQLQSGSDTTASTSHVKIGGDTIKIVTNGHSVAADATVTGEVSFDGQPLLPQGFASGNIESSMSSSTDISK